MTTICIYAHFDAQGVIKGYVRNCIANIRKEFDELIFVSSAGLASSEKDTIKDHCTTIIDAENIGYDFYCWKKGIDSLGERLNTIRSLVLLNSSVIGPVYPLGKCLSTMARKKVDFWGMTQCNSGRPHLQSYFLCFSGALCASDDFKQYWTDMAPISSRDEVINSYELNLTRYFTRRGFKKGVAFPIGLFIPAYRRIFSKNNLRTNCTLTYPASLLDAGMPFVKITLLKHNPFHVDLSGVYSRLKRIYPWEYITELGETAPLEFNDRPI